MVHIKRLLFPCRSASPGRLAQLEEELFRSAEGGGDVPVVMAVTLSLVEGQRQVSRTQPHAQYICLFIVSLWLTSSRGRVNSVHTL